MDADITVTADGTFATSNTSLQTNGRKHIAFPVDRLVFSSNAYTHSDKKETRTAVTTARIY